MIALDIRTIFFISIILMAVSAGVVAALWSQHRDRIRGTSLWLLYAIMQLVSVALFALRDIVSDLLSIVVGNAVLVVGALAMYAGLRRYLGVRDQPWRDALNYAVGVACILVNAYFTISRPDLAVRLVSTSLMLVVLSSQSAWLLLRRAAPGSRPATRAPGLVFVALVAVNALRIPFEVFGPRRTDLLASGLPNALVLVASYTLSVALAFALLLMVNRRLVSELECDIAEREQAEEALTLSQEEFSVVFENVPDAMMVTREDDGVILEANQGFLRFCGHSKGDVVGKTTLDLDLWVDPMQRSALADAVRAAGRVLDFEATLHGALGQPRDVRLSVEIIHIRESARMLTVIHDETEQKQAQRALSLSEAKFATAFRTSPDAVNINRLSDGMYFDINEGFTELMGYTQADVAGKTSADIDIWADPADRQRLVEGLLGTGVVHNLEARFRRKDGWLTTGLMSAHVMEIDGELCILSVTRDISDRRAAEDEILRLNQELEMRVQARTEELSAMNEELIDSNARLEEATRAKSDFLASMSHELRTPLNSIIGFSNLLTRGMVGELEPEQAKQIRMINASGQHLLELVNDALDLSAIEAGRMRIEHRPMGALASVRAVVESLSPLAADRGLELFWSVEPESLSLVSDRTRLEQVLFNILGNAIKFTDRGWVRVSVRRVGDEIAFAISDTGPGITEHDLTRIFDDFYQVERRDIAKSEGTGLGLTVSRRIIEMLGGTIGVESRVGEGSTFTVRFLLSPLS